MLENRWAILAVIFVARLALAFQFQSAGSIAPFLVRDLAVDYTMIGTLIGLYMLPGLAMALPGGYLGRRFGDKRIVLVGLALMALGGAQSAMAGSIGTLLAGRALSGIGAAFLFVLMTKMVADWFADRDLVLAMSIFIVGWPAGVAAAQATQGYLAEAFSWNMVMALTAGFAGLALAMLAVFYRPPRTAEAAIETSSPGLSAPEVILVCLAGAIWMLLNAAYLVMLSFAPVLLQERGLPIAEAALTASILSWVSVIAIPAGAAITNRAKRPNVAVFASLTVAMVLGLAIPFAPAPPLTLALYGIAFSLTIPIIAALPAQVLTPRNRGPGFGIYYLWFYGGMAVLTPIGGLLTDWAETAAAAIVFATGMVASCLVLFQLFQFLKTRWSPGG